MNRKGFAPVILLLILAVLVVGGIFLYTRYQKSPETNEQKGTQESVGKNPTKNEVSSGDFNLVTSKIGTVPGKTLDPYGNGLDFNIAFDPTGQRVYVIRDNTLTLNGQATGTTSDGAVPIAVSYSPDGRHLAVYYSKKSSLGVGDGYVLVDGNKYDAHGLVNWNMYYAEHSGSAVFTNFSSDGKRVAWVSEPNLSKPQEEVVINGQAGKVYDAILPSYHGSGHPVVFSPDSQHFAYLAGDNEGNRTLVRTYVVVDNQEKGPFQFVSSFAYSPDSKYLAYSVQENNQWYLIVNDHREGPFNLINSDLVFSPDGQQIAFSGYQNSKPHVFLYQLNNFQKTEYFYQDIPGWSIGAELNFSGDSKHIAYSGVGKDGKHMAIFVDGQEKDTTLSLREVSHPALSYSGKRLAYVSSGVAPGVIVDGQKQYAALQQTGYNGILDAPQFNRDESAVTYSVFGNNGRGVVTNDREGIKYSDIYYGPVFSPDQKYVMYGARLGNDLWWVVDPVLAIDPSRTVWATFAVTTTIKTNVMSFDYQFTSDQNAEGYMKISFDDNVVFGVDERYVSKGIHSETVSFGKEYEPGKHIITLRIDPYAEVKSKASISNVRLGFKK